MLNPMSILHVNPGHSSAIKVIDFDWMGADQPIADMDKFLGDNKRDNVGYIAPEFLHGKWHIKNDEWSVGVMLYFMLAGNPPFFSDNYRDTIKQIMNYKFDMQSERWMNISPEGRDLISKLMAFRPEDRPTALEAISHPWFKRAQRGELDNKDLGEALLALKNFHTGSRLKQAMHNYFV